MSDKNLITVLDKGFIRLVDLMGSDADIADSARVSFKNHNKESKNAKKKDRQLIRYLIRHGHWSPLQQCNIKIHMKAPIFVLRQFMRHSFVYNESSGRYTTTELSDFYIPSEEYLNKQSVDNKQGRSDELVENTDEVSSIISDTTFDAEMDYRDLLDKGLAKEVARIVLPLSTYSELYVNMDLRTCLHMIRQRIDSHAQREIRDYAEAIAKIVKERFPDAWEAFEDYVLNGKQFSRMELSCIKYMLENNGSLTTKYMRSVGMTNREIEEFSDYLKITMNVKVLDNEEVKQ